jgi:hypothetical protein
MSLSCFLFGHRWRPQAVQSRNEYDPNRPSERLIGEFTRVLLRCERCPRTKVHKLDGHWTLEQLLLGEEMTDSPIKDRVQ